MVEQIFMISENSSFLIRPDSKSILASIRALDTMASTMLEIPIGLLYELLGKNFSNKLQHFWYICSSSRIPLWLVFRIERFLLGIQECVVATASYSILLAGPWAGITTALFTDSISLWLTKGFRGLLWCWLMQLLPVDFCLMSNHKSGDLGLVCPPLSVERLPLFQGMSSQRYLGGILQGRP